MLEHLINQYLPTLIHLLETMGIIVLAVGAFDGFYCYLKGLLHNNFTITKSHFANSMAMSLEFKLAAEILKTVLVRTLDEIIILGAITVSYTHLTLPTT